MFVFKRYVNSSFFLDHTLEQSDSLAIYRADMHIEKNTIIWRVKSDKVTAEFYDVGLETLFTILALILNRHTPKK